MRLLHAEFVGLRTTSYRQRMFRLIRQLRPQTTLTAETNLYLLLNEAQQGADGLEPLIIAYVDAVARMSDRQAHERVTAALMYAGSRIHWHYSKPFAGTLVSLGRFDTSVIVDIRADAMRNILEEMLRSPDHLLIEDLFSLDTTWMDICELSPLADLPSTLDPLALNADQEREDMCRRVATSTGRYDVRLHAQGG